MMTSSFERRVMKRLLMLADSSRGKTRQNPVVSAAVVMEGRVVAEGIHQGPGYPHAEVVALQKVKGKAMGATLLVTLEPCTHVGQTPPCTEAIIEAGISRVVYAISDPNPLVQQRDSEQLLQEKGIQVEKGLLKDEAYRVNDVYFKWIQKKTPFVSLKVGMSLDGKIALASGESHYITGVASRKKVHQLRREVDAMIVGIGTVLTDDPLLNVRFRLSMKGYTYPKKIVLDSQARTPLHAKLFDSHRGGEVVIVVDPKKAPKARLDLLKKKATVWEVPSYSEGLSWTHLMDLCYKDDLFHILIEGGGQVYSSALSCGIVDKVHLFMAPVFLGEKGAVSAFSLPKIKALMEAKRLVHLTRQGMGEDTLLTGYLRNGL